MVLSVDANTQSPCSLPVVEYMECDIGQTEFTPPGCVSLSSVTEPVLGMDSATSAVTRGLFRF